MAGALIALLVGTALAFVHRGYPNAVYMVRMGYVHYEEGQPPKEATVQLWTDPRSGRMRLTGRNLATCPGRWLLTRDWIQCLGAGPDMLPLTPQALRDNDLLIAAWRRTGLGGPGRVLLALAAGSVRRDSLGGRPVLVVSCAPLDRAAFLQDVYWLDAQSDAILQVVTMNGAGYTNTYRIEDEATYAPNALPATFFDPPEGPSLLDKLSAWASGHIRAAS